MVPDTAPSGTVREYVWIEHRNSGNGIATGAATPLAVVADVDTATPKTYYVHPDHLDRPAMMTDSAGSIVWKATFLPFGSVHQITGSAANDNRFPGQWYQLESGLHYNWHRHYDPDLGRYTQPDPLGLIDGPVRYNYALNSPVMYTDPRGEFVPVLLGIAAGLALEATADYLERDGCGCGQQGSYVPQYAAAAAAGATVGDAIGGKSYPRSGFGKGRSTGHTSRLSSGLSRVMGQFKRGRWAPTVRNPLSTTARRGRYVARWLGWASAAYIGYDAYRIVRCLRR